MEENGNIIIKNFDEVISKDKIIYNQIVYKSHMYILDKKQMKVYPNIVNYRCINYLKNQHLSKSFFCDKKNSR